MAWRSRAGHAASTCAMAYRPRGMAYLPTPWRTIGRMAWHREHLPDPLPAEPLNTAALWLAEATRRAAQPNPNAMILATVGRDALPSARVVLCKQITPVPGFISFYTNYQSRKGQELHDNPRAAIVMHWDSLHRQLRVEGCIVPTSAADSDAYFATRHWQSRLGAWASQQSKPTASRADLLAAVATQAQRLGVPVAAPLLGHDPSQETGHETGPGLGAESLTDPGVPIPRPPYWGGYQLWAEAVELWVEGSARIHDRARWSRTLTPRDQRSESGAAFTVGPWSVTRLQP